jgi:alkylhydroperoxidase family enzyme
LATGVRFDSCYELSQHEEISASVGVTSAQRAAVVVKKWDCPDLSESQQALLAFVAAVADGPTVPDEIFGAVQRCYSEQQIIEAVILTGYYFLIARVSTRRTPSSRSIRRYPQPSSSRARILCLSGTFR